MTKVLNDRGGWNLATLCTITVWKMIKAFFDISYIFWNFAKFGKNGQIFKNYLTYQKCRDHFLDNILQISTF